MERTLPWSQSRSVLCINEPLKAVSFSGRAKTVPARFARLNARLTPNRALSRLCFPFRNRQFSPIIPCWRTRKAFRTLLLPSRRSTGLTRASLFYCGVRSTVGRTYFVIRETSLVKADVCARTDGEEIRGGMHREKRQGGGGRKRRQALENLHNNSARSGFVPAVQILLRFSMPLIPVANSEGQQRVELQWKSPGWTGLLAGNSRERSENMDEKVEIKNRMSSRYSIFSLVEFACLNELGQVGIGDVRTDSFNASCLSLVPV